LIVGLVHPEVFWAKDQVEIVVDGDLAELAFFGGLFWKQNHLVAAGSQQKYPLTCSAACLWITLQP
jgi:hypothetical protein